MFAIFNALCSNIALVATLRYPQAFLLPKDDISFYALVRISILSTFGFSVMIFLLLTWKGSFFLGLLQAEKLYDYFYLIPVGVLVISLNQIVGKWQHRLNAFKKAVTLGTSVLIGARLFNLVYGILSNGMKMGLILGDLAGKCLGLVLGWSFIVKKPLSVLWQKIPAEQLKNAVQEYKVYPLMNLPGVWLVLFAEQLPFFFISSTFGLEALGLLSLAISMLDIPKRLFAYSLSSVFHKKAMELSSESLEKLRTFIRKAFFGLAILSIMIYGVVIAFGEPLFAFAFGPEWAFSGKFSQYMALYFVLEIIAVSFDSVFYVLRKEKTLFYFQAIYFIGRLIVLLMASNLSFDLEAYIVSLTLFNLGYYIAYLAYMFRLLNISSLKNTSR